MQRPEPGRLRKRGHPLRAHQGHQQYLKSAHGHGHNLIQLVRVNRIVAHRNAAARIRQ